MIVSNENLFLIIILILLLFCIIFSDYFILSSLNNDTKSLETFEVKNGSFLQGGEKLEQNAIDRNKDLEEMRRRDLTKPISKPIHEFQPTKEYKGQVFLKFDLPYKKTKQIFDLRQIYNLRQMIKSTNVQNNIPLSQTYKKTKQPFYDSTPKIKIINDKKILQNHTVVETQPSKIVFTRAEKQLHGKDKQQLSLKKPINSKIKINKKVKSEQTRLKQTISDFEGGMLIGHNNHRINHHVKPFAWNELLAKEAKIYAKKLCKKECSSPNKFTTHSKYGQSIYSSVNVDGVKFGKALADETIDEFYKESKNYNFKKPGKKDNAARFTQMIWRETSQIGAAFELNNDGTSVIVVCRYKIPGNIQGDYRDNVLSTDMRVY